MSCGSSVAVGWNCTELDSVWLLTVRCAILSSMMCTLREEWVFRVPRTLLQG